jgi:polyketide cyclase/dehydrase/lipid transport protein
MSIRGTKVRVSTHISAPVSVVWREIEQIEHHVTWMRDAVAIRFHTEQHRGVGTVFECDTKVGPLQLTDVMEIIEWSAERTMSVRHTGAVSGTGRFTLRSEGGSDTTLLWEEDLSFPWWLGSELGATVARPIFTVLWKGNLRRFSENLSVRAGTGEHGQ